MVSAYSCTHPEFHLGISYIYIIKVVLAVSVVLLLTVIFVDKIIFFVVRIPRIRSSEMAHLKPRNNSWTRRIILFILANIMNNVVFLKHWQNFSTKVALCFHLFETLYFNRLEIFS